MRGHAAEGRALVVYPTHFMNKGYEQQLPVSWVLTFTLLFHPLNKVLMQKRKKNIAIIFIFISEFFNFFFFFKFFVGTL